MKFVTVKQYVIGFKAPKRFEVEGRDESDAEMKLRFLSGDYLTPKAYFMREETAK